MTIQNETIHISTNPNQLLPKMESVRLIAAELIPLMEHMVVGSNDNLKPNVYIRASFDPKSEWLFGNLENSTYFIFEITPAQYVRDYKEGDNVKVKLLRCSRIVSGFKQKFRAKTTSPDSAIALVKEWILSARVT